MPPQFLAQIPGVANPPSLLLPLVWLVDAATELAADAPSGTPSLADDLAARARLSSAKELRHLEHSVIYLLHMV